MADRRFQITKELIVRYCTLSVPPGAEIKSQITNSEVRKTKNIANLRIHVERAIKRIKSYRILKSVLPLIVLHSCDDIIRTCAGQWNLKPYYLKILQRRSDICYFVMLCLVLSCKSNLTRNNSSLGFLSFHFWVCFLRYDSWKCFLKKSSFKFAVLKCLICSEVLFFS